jgi:HEAT repeat protein
VELLQDETQPLEVRTAAARSLGLLASPEAAPNLIALLQAPPDPKQAALREALTAALGTVKSPAAVTELISLIQPAEKDVTVRTLAAEALGHASALDKDRMILAVTALIQVLIARDPTGKQVTPSEVRIAAAHALGGMACPPEMAGAVHEGLRTAIINDDEYWVRLAAKQALG